MHNLSILSAALLAAAVSTTANTASAQDSGLDWSGAYAGLFGSINSSDTGVTDMDGVGGGIFAFNDISSNGMDAGAFAGYNFQRGNMVYGLEIAVAHGGASGNSVVDTANLDETLEWEVNNSKSLSARIGTVRGNTLFYGSAGVTNASVTYGYLNYNDARTVVESDSRTTSTFNGYVLGVGAEHALTDRVSVRGELLHSEYSDKILEVVPGLGRIEYSPSNTALRAAVAIQF